MDAISDTLRDAVLLSASMLDCVQTYCLVL